MPASRYREDVLIDHAGLDADARARLEAVVAGHRILEHVVRWCAAQRPPRPIADIITQDEYTHDVIIPWEGALHLVYDTT